MFGLQRSRTSSAKFSNVCDICQFENKCVTAYLHPLDPRLWAATALSSKLAQCVHAGIPQWKSGSKSIVVGTVLSAGFVQLITIPTPVASDDESILISGALFKLDQKFGNFAGPSSIFHAGCHWSKVLDRKIVRTTMLLPRQPHNNTSGYNRNYVWNSSPDVIKRVPEWRHAAKAPFHIKQPQRSIRVMIAGWNMLSLLTSRYLCHGFMEIVGQERRSRIMVRSHGKTVQVNMALMILAL